MKRRPSVHAYRAILRGLWAWPASKRAAFPATPTGWPDIASSQLASARSSGLRDKICQIPELLQQVHRKSNLSENSTRARSLKLRSCGADGLNYEPRSGRPAKVSAAIHASVEKDVRTDLQSLGITLPSRPLESSVPTSGRDGCCSIHKPRSVQEWLPRHPGVKLYFSPCYKPQLNPIEKVWKLLKAVVTANLRWLCLSMPQKLLLTT